MLLAVVMGVMANAHDRQPEQAPITVIATGIPGAGAVTQIGLNHLGSPFGVGGNPAFIATTAPGQVFDPVRLLVASSSNFGAPISRADQYEGSILSIDPNGGAVSIASGFAASSTLAAPQPSTSGGRVRLFTANSPAFSNLVNYAASPTVLTKPEVAASLPLGISLNNAFGRPWFANAPTGEGGNGTITVIDFNGRPFAGSPSPTAGGVFSGTVTNRGPSSIGGLTKGVVATSLITKSPDGTGRAVFFAAMADGSVQQVHVQKGVDQLAPPGTFSPLTGLTPANVQSTDGNVVTRVGMVFNWAPTPILYITDPARDEIVALDLGTSGTDANALFTVKARRVISGCHLNHPTDLVGTSVEVAARNFASGTVLGVGSDLYVLNRGDNTIVRIDQNGREMARRTVSGLPGMRVAGIAVNDTGRTIYVTATLPGGDGAVLSTPAFGSHDQNENLLAAATAAGTTTAAQQGQFVFFNSFSTDQGAGPLFNGHSCASCHNHPAPAGMGTGPETFVVRVAKQNGSGQHLLESGPVARQNAIDNCSLPTGVPPQANVTSVRSAMTLRGTSKIDNILDAKIIAVMNAQPAEIRGRPNYDANGRIGKFGWKAQTVSLVEFMGDALRDEMGVTNPLQPDDVNGCGQGNSSRPELDGIALTSLVGYLNTVDPADSASCNTTYATGAALFSSIGCSTCHTPSMPGPGSPTASERPVRLYSDLLLHDMGLGLADGLTQGQATSSEFRTAPLWGAGTRTHFLHDGRASTITQAVQAHEGQAAAAAAEFDALTATQRQALLDFLGCI